MGPRFRNSAQVDFVIVGSGAAGAILARQLPRARFSTVLFEQGPRLSPANFEHDELKYWFLGGITNDAARNPQTFRSDPTQQAALIKDKPPLWYARTVGGTSVHFTANYWRFHEVDFNERSRLGAIPGADLVDWPITYAELEPYYTKVDWEIGERGVRRAVWADPFRPPPQKAVPDATTSCEIFRSALRAGSTQAGLASLPRTDGDQFAAVSRAPRLRELWLLPWLRL